MLPRRAFSSKMASEQTRVGRVPPCATTGFLTTRVKTTSKPIQTSVGGAFIIIMKLRIGHGRPRLWVCVLQGRAEPGAMQVCNISGSVCHQPIHQHFSLCSLLSLPPTPLWLTARLSIHPSATHLPHTAQLTWVLQSVYAVRLEFFLLATSIEQLWIGAGGCGA